MEEHTRSPERSAVLPAGPSPAPPDALLEQQRRQRNHQALRNLPAEFWMSSYKVVLCEKRKPHHWQNCLMAHEGERARRRHPLRYSSKACPDVTEDGSCARGDACPFSHSIFEQYLHPERFRTRMCENGADCTRRVCFFAHSSDELRSPPEHGVDHGPTFPLGPAPRGGGGGGGGGAAAAAIAAERAASVQLVALGAPKQRSEGGQPGMVMPTAHGGGGISAMGAASAGAGLLLPMGMAGAAEAGHALWAQPGGGGPMTLVDAAPQTMWVAQGGELVGGGQAAALLRGWGPTTDAAMAGYGISEAAAVALQQPAGGGDGGMVWTNAASSTVLAQGVVPAAELLAPGMLPLQPPAAYAVQQQQLQQPAAYAVQQHHLQQQQHLHQHLQQQQLQQLQQQQLQQQQQQQHQLQQLQNQQFQQHQFHQQQLQQQQQQLQLQQQQPFLGSAENWQPLPQQVVAPHSAAMWHLQPMASPHEVPALGHVYALAAPGQPPMAAVASPSQPALAGGVQALPGPGVAEGGLDQWSMS